MAFNDVYRLAVKQSSYSQQVINVMHFSQVDVAAGNLSQQLAEDFRDNIGTAWRARASTAVQMIDVTVQRIIPYGDAPAVAPWAAGVFGTRVVSSAGAGPMLCQVVTLYTGFTGRRKRGRLYLSGLYAGDINGDQWSASATTALTTMMSTLYSRYDGVGVPNSFRLGVWSRVIGGATPPYSSDGFSPVTSYTIRTAVRSQRRRGAGVGA